MLCCVQHVETFTSFPSRGFEGPITRVHRGVPRRGGIERLSIYIHTHVVSSESLADSTNSEPSHVREDHAGLVVTKYLEIEQPVR